MAIRHRGAVRRGHVLVVQFPPDGRRVLDLHHVAFSRPRGGRIARRTGVEPLPRLRHRARADGVRERAVDERWWLPCDSYGHQRVLEVLGAVH